MAFPQYPFPFEFYSDDPNDPNALYGFADFISSPIHDPPWPYVPQEPNAQNPPCESSQAVAIPGSDPVPGSDLVSKSVAVGNAHSGEEVINDPVGESSDPVAVTGSDPVLGSVPTSDSDTIVKVSEAVVSESSDPVAVSNSDPVSESDALMCARVVKGWKSFKQRSKLRIKRARGTWNGRAYNLELAGGSNQIAVDSSDGKRGKRSRKGTKVWKESLSGLPDGWNIISKTRIRGASAGATDKYYEEPITGKRFRSKIAVQRYLKILPSAKSKRPRK